jgi:hypothetical protein
MSTKRNSPHKISTVSLFIYSIDITPQNLLSSTFKNFDDLGDTQKMDDELFRADKNVLNNTFNNLLSFKSGKDLSKTFH